MMRLGPVLFICGLIVTMIGGAMLFPSLVDLAHGNILGAEVFAIVAGATIFFGLLLSFANHNNWNRLTVRETFLMTSLCWVLVSLFAALPFCFSSLQLSYTDAFFETMSGLTTTGSTILSGLDNMPHGVLLWRAILQWLGGIGIIVMAIAILPFLRIGGMQLFSTESSDTAGKTFPRVSQIVSATIGVYLTLSAACAISYSIAGMSLFDAVTHMMTTVSTGGYATSDKSMGAFNSPTIEWICTLFMMTGGLPLVFFLQIITAQWDTLKQDSQAFRYLLWLILFTCFASVWFWQTTDMSYADALRSSAFHIVSLVTTTGYATTDYSLWGPVAIAFFFILTCMGGCTGSTAGGIKIFRLRILYLATIKHFKTMLSPHGVFVSLYNGRPVKEDVMTGVLVFMAAFAFTVGALTLVLALFGIDFMTALTGALTAVANVGPGFGEIIGPAGNFASLPDGAKWALTFGMLVGRLEFLTVFVLFVPSAWKS